MKILQTNLKSLIVKLKNKNCLSLEEIFELWQKHDSESWRKFPELYLALGKRILSVGEALMAYDVFSEGLNIFNNLVNIKDAARNLQPVFLNMLQQQALALAQSGALVPANKILKKLQKQGVNDGETLGILGRTYKDMAIRSSSFSERKKYFRSAYKIYFDAFNLALKNKNTDDAYYNGINAATLSLVIGKKKESYELAKIVKKICLKKIKIESCKNISVSHWLLATLGEAELILGNFDTAKKMYSKASAQSDIRGVASMRKQARMILKSQGNTINILDCCFKVPTIVVFSGHIIDQPTRPKKRFPKEIEKEVRKEISIRLEKMNAGIAYSSAACGSDIIFLEEMLKRGGEINIVLPFDLKSFKKESVDVIPKSNWSNRFDKILEKAAQVKVLGYHNPETDIYNYEFANLFILGSALARKNIIDTTVKTMAVWDGKPGDGLGGTASAINQWQKSSKEFEHIDLKKILKEKSAKYNFKNSNLKKIVTNKTTYHTYLPMLFADIKGFSKFSEKQLISFSENFLKKVSIITSKYKTGILSKRTAGDGLFFMFKNLKTACNVALELQRCVAETDWTNFGLPEDLSVRISLDAGPCYTFKNPVINEIDFSGNYINRAARIEPITPPGYIYASESFVALSNAEGINSVRFDYAGQVILPKNFGIIPVYNVRQFEA